VVLGRYGEGTVSTVAEFHQRHAILKESGLATDEIWSVCAFGRGEIACLEAAMLAGGHARVGFENSIHSEDGGIAEDNASRVTIVAERARRLGRELAFGLEAREIIDVL
jgi:uncharacterized protein (DUF849 family)